MAGMRKQVSFFLPVAQWVLIRNEAIRLGVPITELIRRWMSDEMRRLEQRDLRTREGKIA
jgi:hypothetical protein